MRKEKKIQKSLQGRGIFSFILTKFKVLGYKKTALKGGCL